MYNVDNYICFVFKTHVIQILGTLTASYVYTQFNLILIKSTCTEPHQELLTKRSCNDDVKGAANDRTGILTVSAV